VRRHPPGSPPAAASPAEFRRVFQRLLRLRWDNQRLKVYWWLALDGLPAAVRLHRPRAAYPGCGALGLDTVHHLWDCPLAVAVQAPRAGGLPALAGVGLGHDHV
jgi:hypothetical protein